MRRFNENSRIGHEDLIKILEEYSQSKCLDYI